MPKDKNLEFKVGVFVLLALIGLTAFIFSVSDFSVFKEGKLIKVVFGFSNGLKKSAPVRISGVDKGIVKKIDLFFDNNDRNTKVEVELYINDGVRIPKDSVVMINQLGLMGEKYIEIIPGSNTTQFIEEGQTIVGKDPIAQEIISERVMEVANKIEHTISGVNNIINDKGKINSLGGTLENMNNITGSLNEIVANVKEGKGLIGKLLYDEVIYDDLKGLTGDIKQNPWKLLYRPKHMKGYTR